jgi:small subunit ribosomal protein S20
MPVTKSAKKKLRKDKKREKGNDKLRRLLKKALKKAKKNPLEKTVKEAVKTVDKASQKNIIHKNKAARIKKGLAKLIKKEVKTPKTSKAPSVRKTKAAKK